VDDIIGENVEPMALRLSGQLLLGVVRIYSRKTKYLLDDCNEALVKIKISFQNSTLDLHADQALFNAVTITEDTAFMKNGQIHVNEIEMANLEYFVDF
jgi:cohesin complex subunit SCC1